MPPYTALVTLLSVALYFLLRDTRCCRPWQVRRAPSGDDRRCGLRARLPRPSEHSRVDADLPGSALDLRAFPERPRSRLCRLAVAARPGCLCDRLQPRRREALARLLHPIKRLHPALFRRRDRRCVASPRRLMARVASSTTHGEATEPADVTCGRWTATPTNTANVHFPPVLEEARVRV